MESGNAGDIARHYPASPAATNSTARRMARRFIRGRQWPSYFDVRPHEMRQSTSRRQPPTLNSAAAGIGNVDMPHSEVKGAAAPN